MSLGLGTAGRAAIDAIEACDQMLRRLSDVIERHAAAAARARPDWEGPHRDEFDDRFERAQHGLQSAEAWVLLVRRGAYVVLADAREQLRETLAATTPAVS